MAAGNGVRGSGGRSGAQSRTFNQEIFEKKFAFAGVERTAAAKARHITLGRWPGRASNPTTSYFAAQTGQWNSVAIDFIHTRGFAIQLGLVVWPRSFIVALGVRRVRGHWRTGTPKAIQHRPALVWETMQLGLRSGPGSLGLRLWNSKLPTARFLGS